MKINWFNAYQIEREAQLIFEQQFRDGWYFDTELALVHRATLEHNLEEIYDRVRPSLTKVLEIPYKGKEVAKPFIKSGDHNAVVKRWFGEDPKLLSEVAGPFCRIKWNEPNMGSSEQMKAMLFRLGWEPTQWNTKFMVRCPVSGLMVPADKNPDIKGRRVKTKTSPKVTEDSFDSIKGTGIGEDLKKYLIYRSRLSDLKRYIGGVREDHTIPSFLNNPGTPTARVTHSLVTNVAASDAVFGKEMRELFRARPGRVIVGEDRSQIEARLIAHVSIQILGHTKLADLIMGRDFHQVMFEALDGLVSSRKKAKTPEYA